MKNLSKFILALSFTTALSACGGQNTLPPMTMYPGQITGQYNQQPTLPGNPIGDPLNNGALPNDVTRGQVGSIVGRVVSRGGAPLHNVQIWLESDPNIKTSSRRGDFTLMNVPVGQHNIVMKFGSLETTAQVNVVPNMAVAPTQNPVLLDGQLGSNALAFASPNKQVAAFKVDQDSFLNLWQAKGLDVSNGNIYISAIDVRSLVKKGTVIQMSTSGEGWKDIAKSWLGLRHTLNSTARGLAMSGSGSILVVDEKSSLFSVDSAGAVTKTEADGALDIASAAGTSWIYSVRGLEKSDDTGSSRSPVSGVAASGGIGVDSQGNAYVPVQNTIMKVSKDGTPAPFIRDYLNSPKDVAIDPRNGDVFILDGGEIKRFDKNGQFIVSFGSSALDPSAIDLDEEGALYIADFARDQRSSQVIKFDPAPLVSATDAAPASAEATTEAAADEEMIAEEDATAGIEEEAVTADL